LQLHAELRAEWFPEGRSQEEVVLDLGNLHWQKRTVMRLRKAVLLKDPYVADIVRTKKKSWAGIRNGLRKQARKEKKALNEVESDLARLLTAMVHDMDRLGDQLEAPEQSTVEVLARKLDSLVLAMHEEVLPMINELRNGAGAKESFANAYVPEALMKLISLEAAIDARINKAVGRLIALKEYKRTPAGAAPSVPRLPAPGQ
jgi:hypothetical protein